jgi:D-glycerate 3-kinase
MRIFGSGIAGGLVQGPSERQCYAALVLWPGSIDARLRRPLPDVRGEVEAWCADERIARPSDALIAEFHLPMAEWVADRVEEGTLVLGLNGAQGTGKSTLARLLKRLLERVYELRVAILSLDDIYLIAAERTRRAEVIHPLLATRGVPGTHDVGLGIRTIRALRQGKPLALPRFDKAHDDRLPVAQWPRWEGRCDVVIFEGWCVGARPQRRHDLQEPINGLERLEDPTGDWRYYVNRELGGRYQELFAEIDVLVMLRPPSFDHVFAWREHQEARLREEGAGSRVMSPTAVRRFVMHFERITRFMWDEMPGRADAVVHLDDDHMPVEIELGDA